MLALIGATIDKIKVIAAISFFNVSLQAYMIFGNKTGFLGNNLSNVDHISMNMRDMRSMKVFKIFSKFQKMRWKNFQVHKNSSGTYITT